MRKRMLYAELFEDEHFSQLSDKAKLLFIACIVNADDEGRLSAHRGNLRAFAFRFEELTITKIDELLKEIISVMENFKLYTINNCDYIQFNKWENYQTIREDRRKPSTIPSCQPNDNPMSDKCQRNISKDKISKVKFTIPTLEEVQSYCKERSNGVDPQRFIDHYTAKGWLIGKNKVVDWKACVRTWEKNTPPKVEMNTL